MAELSVLEKSPDELGIEVSHTTTIEQYKWSALTWGKIRVILKLVDEVTINVVIPGNHRCNIRRGSTLIYDGDPVLHVQSIQNIHGQEVATISML